MFLFFYFHRTFVKDEQIVAVIRLFGCINYELTTHEVRGLNVIVRLHKSCAIMWPRLHASTEKCTWIIQNIDAIKDEDFYEEAVAQFGKFNKIQ